MSHKPLSFDPIMEARRQWELHWGPEPAPAMTAVTSIMRVQQILMAELNELLRGFELTFPRYEALVLLLFSRHGSLPLGKMGERLQVHRTSITNIVDQLERAGLIRRIPDTNDRRTTLAEITPTGRRIAEQATGAVNQALFALPALSGAELDQLAQILQKVRQRAGDFTT